MTEQKIEPPNESELAWVQAHVDAVKDLTGGDTSVGTLDDVYARWYEEWTGQADADREDPNSMINAVGLTFGQRLVEELDLEWAVVTDEHGTEIAVHGQPGDILVFPPNLVAKRFERGETRFLQAVYEGVAEQVTALRRG
jgi:Domain of unknown function (DUF3806)